jgi:O-antigen/teichoic acid export membrane protein
LKNNYSKLIFNYFKAFLSKGVGVIYGLILLKLLAIYLSEEDFSNYFIFYNISFYCYTVFFTIQGSAILRYYHIKGENGIVHFVNILNTFSILINLLFFSIIIFFYNVIDTFSLFTVFVLIQSLGFFNNEINYLRIKHSFDRVLYLLIAQALIAITGVLLFKEILDFRIVLIIITVSFLIPVFLFKSKKNLLLFRIINFNIIKDNLDILKYALPIVFIALANSTMSSIDQIILKYYNFDDGLSAYIANYTIAEKSVVFLLSVITLVFVPTVFKKYDKLSVNVFKDIYRVVIVFILISLPLVLILFNVSDWLTISLTNKDFLNYSWVIPYIALGGVFLGINSIVSEVFTVSKKSIILMYCYVLGMAVNLILNITFIPFYGINGAVFTTIITYIIMSMITLGLAYKQYKNIKINEN